LSATTVRATPLPELTPPSGFASVNGPITSWSLNKQMLRDRLLDAANKMRQTGEILRSAARGQSEAYDRANKGFSYYLRGVEVLEHSPSGRRQLRPRLRGRGGEGGPDQVPPGAAEPVPDDGLGRDDAVGAKHHGRTGPWDG
jgi:hypothetical protein